MGAREEVGGGGGWVVSGGLAATRVGCFGTPTAALVVVVGLAGVTAAFQVW